MVAVTGARGEAPRGVLRRRNPAAKAVAALVVAVGLVPAVDPVTSGAVLGAVALLVPFAGLRWRAVLAVGAPLVLSAFSVGLVNLLFGESGPLTALGMAVRLLAIAVPGVLVMLTSDPTETADALVQHLLVPERPALGVLAALRLVPLLVEQWRTLGLARRARGIDAGRDPFAAAAQFAGKAFALLVQAVRTGTRLAAAMDARGFGGSARTHARTSRWTTADTVLILAAGAVVAAAHLLSIRLGTWALLFG